MNNRNIILVLLAALPSAFVQAEIAEKESLQAYNARMEWFAEAKYGMFIHFGLYSQVGGVWKGKQIKH